MTSIANHKRPMEATMIQGTNVNIGYANLNMTNHQINEAKGFERRYAFDLLRAQCSLAALVDATERYDPPRCTEATRRNVMRKIEDWVYHDSRHGPPSSIFWLYGGAGAGKSALAQTLAEKFKAKGDLAASFFFFKADTNRNNGDRLIPTLVLQLLHSFQGIAPLVEAKILADQDVLKKSRQTQMSGLLAEPVIKLSREEGNGVQPNTAHPRLIVIDGLDECSDPNIQYDLLRIIDNTIPSLPYPLRFLITSRPESHITRAFQHDIKKVARYNLSDDSDAYEDIRIVLEGEFAEIRRTHPLRQHLPSPWPPRSSISSIVERSSGHFIYASTVIRYIQSPQHRPDDRLQVILGLKQAYEKDRPYAPLDSLYRLIFLEVQDPGQLEKIHHAFGIMHLRSLHSGLFTLPQWTSDRYTIETLLELRSGDLVLLFDRLLSLVTFDRTDIRIFHKSLFDYLLDPSRSEDLRLDLSLAHELAANYILREENILNNWESAEFQNFAYHCQFAHLNDTIKGHLRSLASNPKMLVTPSSTVCIPPFQSSCLLQSLLYFLQVIGRKDFDLSGHYYRKYVKKMTRCFRKIVPWGQRLKCIIPRALLESISLKRSLHMELSRSFGNIDFRDLQLPDTSGFYERIVPTINTTIVKAIEREHELFSSYVKAHHQYPDIVASLLESSSGLVHSCHIVIRSMSVASMTFAMLVTYTEGGVRLSCTEVRTVELSPMRVLALDYTPYFDSLVSQHLSEAENQINSTHTTVYSPTNLPHPSK